MSNGFEVQAKITLDSSGYESGLSKAESKASGFSSSLRGKLATAAKFGATAITTISAAAVAVGAAFAKGTADVAQYGDRVDKMSQKMGMTATSFQEWDFVMQHCGTTIDSLQTGMKTLANAAETGNKAFEQLGLSQEQIANMSQEELFSATITALQNVEDKTQRTYLAGKLLGRGATELGALLNMSADETEDLKNQLHELNGIMSDEAVKASAQYQDSLQNMQVAFSGVRNELFSRFLPSLSTVMDGIAELFSGRDGGINKVSEGIKEFAEGISRTLPTAVRTFSNLISVAVESLASELPSIISSLLSTLPEVVGIVLESLTSIVNSIADNAGVIIPMVVDTILNVADAIIDHLPELLEAAISVIISIAEALPDAITKITDRLPEMMKSIIEAVVEVLPDLIEGIITGVLENTGAFAAAGVELFVSLIALVPEIVVGILQHLPEIIEGIISGFANFFSDMEEVGSEMVSRIGFGFEGQNGLAYDWGKSLIENLFDGMIDSIMQSDIAQDFMTAVDHIRESIGVDPLFSDFTQPQYTQTEQTAGKKTSQQLAQERVQARQKEFEHDARLSRQQKKNAQSLYSDSTKYATNYYSNLTKQSESADILGADVAKEQATEIGKIYKGLEKNAKNSGEDFGKAFANGLKAATSAVSAAAQLLVSAVNSAIGSGSGGAARLGASFAQAFANGISAASSYITSAITSAIQNAIRNVDFGNVTSTENTPSRTERKLTIQKPASTRDEYTAGTVVNVGDIFINDVIPEGEGDMLDKVIREVEDVISRRMAVIA